MTDSPNNYVYAARIAAANGPGTVGLTHYYYDRQILQDIQADLEANGHEILACQLDWTDYVPKVVLNRFKTSSSPVIDRIVVAINV